jgi:hypothetical protein
MATYDISSLLDSSRSVAIEGGKAALKYSVSTYDYLAAGKQCETVVEKASKWINDTKLYKSLYSKVAGDKKEPLNKDSDKSLNQQIKDDGGYLSGYDLLTDAWSVKKPKSLIVSSIEWVENMICVTIPSTIYQILKLIDEALKTPIRLLDLIKDMSDRILEAIENKIMTAIDCIYKNLKDLTNLLKVDFSASFDEIRYILYSCPFLASALSDMLSITCDKCEDPIRCIEEMLQKAEDLANTPYNNSKAYVNKVIHSIRKAVDDFIKKISNKVHKNIDYLIEQYIKHIYDRKMIPMLPFPGDKGPCNDQKRVYMYTIHEALILAKRWIKCIKALCSLASDTAANELDVILKKIDTQTAGIFSSKLGGYIKNRYNKISGIVGADGYSISKKDDSDNILEAFGKIKDGLKSIKDDNTRYYMDNMQEDSTREDLHGLHVPFYKQFATDISNFGVSRALEKGRIANSKSKGAITDANTSEYEDKATDGRVSVSDTNSYIKEQNDLHIYYTDISNHEKGAEKRTLDNTPSDYTVKNNGQFSVTA